MGGGVGDRSAIRRFRPIGELDFSTDGFTSPWGRLAAGDDGYYPAGLASIVRVVPVGGGWIAQAGDGTRYTFGGNDAVTTPRGAFAWMLSRVDSVAGDSTTLQWSRNASGRPFLASVQWGGRNDGTQYRMSFDYEAVPSPFASYASGGRQVLDQRVARVTVGVKQGGGYATRWRYDLGYQASTTGPAFYLHSIAKTYASGASEPPVVYDYDLGSELRASAQFAAVPALAPFLAASGGLALQPDQAVLTDLEQDGLVDLETAFDQTALHQTATGFVAEPLPPAANADPACRPPASLFNRPRTLARMHGDAAEPQAVWIENGWDGATSRVLVCDRRGAPIDDQIVDGTWQLDENTRLADLDADQRPDLVRVAFGEADVLRNTSTGPQALSFAPGPTTFLTPQFTPTASWVLDVNGDGRADLVSRFDGGIVVWLGTGGGQFDPSGTTYGFDTADGPLADFSSYQLSFGDFNGDGLSDVILTQGQAVHLFTNRGDAFVETPVPALQDIPWLFAFPLIADLSGTGNEEAVFVTDAQAMAIQLTSPSTGLLRSADDGKGTVLRFGYGRVRPAAGIRRRYAVVNSLTVESSGYDTVSYSYDYGAPVLHTVGKYLVGFAGVDKRSPFLTEHVGFLNDDDVSGVRGLSEDTDERTPGIVRFTSRLYDDVRHRGVRWLRPSSVEAGHRSPDGSVRLSTTTRYAVYERDFCPTVVTTSAPGGQRVRTSTLASVAAIPDDLHCLAAGETVLGTHADPALDFNYLASIARNDLGQITRASQIDPAGRDAGPAGRQLRRRSPGHQPGRTRPRRDPGRLRRPRQGGQRHRSGRRGHPDRGDRSDQRSARGPADAAAGCAEHGVVRLRRPRAPPGALGRRLRRQPGPAAGLVRLPGRDQREAGADRQPDPGRRGHRERAARDRSDRGRRRAAGQRRVARRSRRARAVVDRVSHRADPPQRVRRRDDRRRGGGDDQRRPPGARRHAGRDRPRRVRPRGPDHHDPAGQRGRHRDHRARAHRGRAHHPGPRRRRLHRRVRDRRRRQADPPDRRARHRPPLRVRRAGPPGPDRHARRRAHPGVRSARPARAGRARRHRRDHLQL